MDVDPDIERDIEEFRRTGWRITRIVVVVGAVLVGVPLLGAFGYFMWLWNQVAA